jgi:hypothetical protein
MPIVIPAFVQFQAPLFPLRGLWNVKPAEGDRFVNAEIDWAVTTGALNAVQFALSGNSPVAFTQIVALSVDNSRCAVDVDFLFPDSGFVLTVPGYNQGVYPVFTNALMFYAVATGAAVGDSTILQVLNSMPPPVAIQPSMEQSVAAVSNVNLAVAATTPLIPTGVSGTIEAFSLLFTSASAAAGGVTVQLIDGTARQVWGAGIALQPESSASVNLSPLRIRFYNGLNAVVSNTTLTIAGGNFTIYYGVP